MGDMLPQQILILGLDGLCWPALEPLLDAGTMPNLGRLRREGAWGSLTSVVPTESATAWASFLTGQNPARHGVTHFTVRQADGHYRHAKPEASATFWHHLNRHGRRVGLINFPVTYPPDPIGQGGFLVSGMLSPQGETFTYPPELGADLLAAVPGYRIDLEWLLYNRREQALLRDLTDMVRWRAQAAAYLRDRYQPDCLAVAFTSPDRLQHALWRHLDPTHPHYDQAEAAALRPALYRFYAALDDAIGSLVFGLGGDAAVIAVSDHGFQAVAWQFRVDDWLATHGWLVRQGGRSRIERWVRRLDVPWVRHVRRKLVKDVSRHVSTFAPGGTIDWARTAAFCPWNAQQGVRLNVRGRDPHGIIAPEDYHAMRDEIRTALLEAAEPRTGTRVVDRVWVREELYSGPHLEAMPDLALTLRPGFASSPIQRDLWAPMGWASGDHSLAGLFAAWGKGIQAGRVDGARLIDVAPTVLYLLDAPVPDDADGDVVQSALAPELLAAHPVRREAVGVVSPGSASVEQVLTGEQEAEITRRLQGLGYL